MIFLKACLLGVLLGMLYDIFRILRRFYRFGKISIFVQDILFFLIAALCTLLFILAVNEGKFRGFIVFGELSGAVVYFFTVSRVILKITEMLLKLIHKIFALVYKLLIAPIFHFSSWFGRLIRKVFAKSLGNIKNIKRIRLFHLKRSKKIVYNKKIVSKRRCPIMGKGKGIRGTIIFIGLVAFTIYVIVSMVVINNSLQTKKAQTAEINEQINETTATNKELQELLDNGIEEYIIKIAKERLGLVFPSERVYYDIDGN